MFVEKTLISGLFLWRKIIFNKNERMAAAGRLIGENIKVME